MTGLGIWRLGGDYALILPVPPLPLVGRDDGRQDAFPERRHEPAAANTPPGAWGGP